MFEFQAARSRLEKTTAAAHARNKVTFNPQISTSTSKVKPKGKKVGRLVSFTDGEVLDDDGDKAGAIAGSVGGSPKGKGKAKSKGKRQSRRSHTILNTSATVFRMKTAEKRRVSTVLHHSFSQQAHLFIQATNPKKQPTIQKSYTQAQLLSRALDTEEGNIIEHRDYLQMEEEKRRRARVVRKVVEGPKVKWVSRGEEVKVQVPVQVVGPGYGYPSHGYGSGSYYSYVPGGSQHSTTIPPNNASMSSGHPHYSNVQAPLVSLSASTTMLTPTPVYYSNQPPSQSQQQQGVYYYSPQQPPQARLEKICKNYVVHEVSQPPIPSQSHGQAAHAPLKPLWEETMAALFGGDVKWEDMKVWSGKGRPLCTSLPLFSAMTNLYFSSHLSSPKTNLPSLRPLSAIPRPTHKRPLRECACVPDAD